MAALVLGILVFVLGVPFPWNQPPPPMEPPTVAFTWVPLRDVPENSIIVTSEDLEDYGDVVEAAHRDGNGTLVMEEARYDALSRYLDGRCIRERGGPCFSVLYDQGKYYIMLLI